MRKYLVAAAIVSGICFHALTPAGADYHIRATEFGGGGGVEFSKTLTKVAVPGKTFTADFSGDLGDFTVTIVTNISSTGPGFSSHTATISVTYSGPTGKSGTSDKLLVEVLGTDYINPTAPADSTITSNGSPSTPGGASGGNVDAITMTSGVVAAVALDGTAGTTLGGQFGMTTGTGSIVGGLSSILVPNPANSATAFSIFNPFSFYQTYTFDGFSTTGTLGLSAASSVAAVTPAPASLMLAIAALTFLGGYSLVRRRKTTQLA